MTCTSCNRNNSNAGTNFYLQDKANKVRRTKKSNDEKPKKVVNEHTGIRQRGGIRSSQY